MFVLGRLLYVVNPGVAIEVSGIDERKDIMSLKTCSKCGRNVLTWLIKSTVQQAPLPFFNCTDRWGGPDYSLVGPFESIEYFKCKKCQHKFKRGSVMYRRLINVMKVSPHVSNNPKRRVGTFEWTR